MYNWSWRFLVKLNTLIRLNTLNWSFQRWTFQKYHGLSTSPHISQSFWTLLTGLFIQPIPNHCRSKLGFRENVTQNHCVLLISAFHTDENYRFSHFYWKQSLITFFSHFHCTTQVVSLLLYTLHPLPLWPRGRHLNWQQPMLETGLSRPGPSSPELDSRPHNWPTPTLPLLNSHITRTAGQTEGPSINYMMTFGVLFCTICGKNFKGHVLDFY